MDSLKNIVKQVMSEYAVEGENGHSYLTENTESDILTVLYISEMDAKTYVDIGLAVRVAGDFAIILHDANSKPLVDALLQAGIPREQIVLAYAGETMEEGSTA